MRERKMVVSERIRETNRLRGLLASQGIADDIRIAAIAAIVSKR